MPTADRLRRGIRGLLGLGLLDQACRDLDYAGRGLWRAKGWTAVIVFLLALGIGANTALFSAINGLFLSKLPVRDPDGLVRLRYAGANQMRTDVLLYGFIAPDARGRPVEATFSYPMYQQLLTDNRTLSELFVFAPFGLVNVVVNGQAETASGFVSSGNYYQALGAAARLGRTIAPDDDRPTAPPVAVISHKYWMSRFGSDPTVVGRSATVNNVPVTLVGVLAPGFTGVGQAMDEAPDVSLPIALEPRLSPRQSLLMQPNWWWLNVMGRLGPGATVQQVHGNLAGVFRQTARAGFDAYLSSLSQAERAQSALQHRTQVPELLVDSGSRGIYDVNTSDVRAVNVLTAVVALVLLIVCANVATLLLSRASARQRELSVRLALGATRSRLIRQLLTESLLLAGIGGSLGILVGRWSQQLLPGVTGQASPLDWRVMAFVIIVTMVTGLVFGVAPALRATRTDVNVQLKENSRTLVASRSLLGRSLLVAQVGISLVVLIGAGLFLRTLHNLRQADVGFNPENVLLFRVNPTLNRYDLRKQNLLYGQIADRLRELPGVRSVAWSSPSLMSGRRFSGSIFVQGRTYARGQRDLIYTMGVSPGFFETMAIPLIAGRNFTSGDTLDAPNVVVINEAAARQYFPNESPIGRRIGPTLENNGRQEIVGILRDAKYNSVREAAVPTMYTSYAQSPHRDATFEVRLASAPMAAIDSIREVVRQVDPAVPLIDVKTQAAEVESRFLQERVFAQAYTLFGGLALVVASIGLFGLMSYSVARRTTEMGIRMAIGAQRDDVLRQVMRESMILVLVGIVLGLGLAIAAGRFVAHLLFGLASTDPAALAGAIAAMVVVSALAAYLPARRASRIDPMVTLRCE